MSMKFEEDGDAVKHLTEFEKLINHLRSFGSELSEDEVISHLMLTFPPSYDSVVAYFDALGNDNRNLNALKARFIQENANRRERLRVEGNLDRKILPENKEEPKVFMSKRGSWRRGKYGRMNNSYRSKGEAKDKDEERKCFLCNKPGHVAKFCRNRNNRKTFFTVGLFTQNDITIDNKIRFYLDSGATDHMISSNYSKFLTNVEVFDDPLLVSCSKMNENLKCYRYGDLNIRCNGVDITMKDVLCIEGLSGNLLSVKRLDRHGYDVCFGHGKVKIFDDRELFLQNSDTGSLYSLIFDLTNVAANNAYVECNDELSRIWHQRFGHLNYKSLNKMKNHDIVDGLDGNFSDISKFDKCETCVISKQHNLPYNKVNDNRSSRPLQLVHTDLVTIDKKGKAGEKYILTFIDDFTSFKAAYPMCSKAECLVYFKEYLNYVHAISEYWVSMIRCDNRKEYCNNDFNDFCRNNGIHIANVDPHSPQLNSCAERNNRTIMERSRAILLQSKLDVKFWPYAVETACYVLNRSIVKNNIKTPVEMLTGKKPNVIKLRIFGSLAFRHIPKQFRGKFDNKGEKCVMVGYSGTGYRLWVPSVDKIRYARNVVFQENMTIADWKEIGGSRCVDDSYFVVFPVEEDIKDGVNVEEASVERAHVEQEAEIGGEDSVVEREPLEVVNTRPSREKKVPGRFQDYVVSCLYSSVEERIPRSYAEAISCDESSQWRAAMEREMESMRSNEVWELVESKNLEKDVECVDSIWLYSVKQTKDEKLYKARLVASGDMIEKEDEEDVFSPVAKPTTVRTLFCIANQNDSKVAFLDIHTAFLNADIEAGRNIYMKQPRGFQMEGKICKLKKSIYGLRNSSKNWNHCFHDFLISKGFERSKYDLCLYNRCINGNRTYLLIYVDDIFIVSDNELELKNFKIELFSRFKTSDLTDSNRFLGIDVEWSNEGVYLSQSKYVNCILKKFRMTNCKPVLTPMEINLKIKENNDEQCNTNKPYRELIGCLSYLSNISRPDISFAVNYLSRFQKNPTEEMYNYAKRILRYLRGTIDYKLFYPKTKDLELVCYVDADFGSDINDRKSRSGFAFFIGKCLVSWSSCKQRTVALSFSEAEYIALAIAASEGLWLKGLIREMLGIDNKLIMYEDNQNAILYSNNKDNNKRTKHIDVKYRFVNDEIVKGNIDVRYVESENQVSDVLTKPLGSSKFIKHRDSLGICLST